MSPPLCLSRPNLSTYPLLTYPAASSECCCIERTIDGSIVGCHQGPVPSSVMGVETGGVRSANSLQGACVLLCYIADHSPGTEGCWKVVRPSWLPLLPSCFPASSWLVRPWHPSWGGVTRGGQMMLNASKATKNSTDLDIRVVITCQNVRTNNSQWFHL